MVMVSVSYGYTEINKSARYMNDVRKDDTKPVNRQNCRYLTKLIKKV